MAQILTNLEDIKSHWSVYCIEFSLVDNMSFPATEAIVLYIFRLDPTNNQLIDVQNLTSVRADMLMSCLSVCSFYGGLNICSLIIYRVTFQLQFHVDTSFIILFYIARFVHSDLSNRIFVHYFFLKNTFIWHI